MIEKLCTDTWPYLAHGPFLWTFSPQQLIRHFSPLQSVNVLTKNVFINAGSAQFRVKTCTWSRTGESSPANLARSKSTTLTWSRNGTIQTLASSSAASIACETAPGNPGAVRGQTRHPQGRQPVRSSKRSRCSSPRPRSTGTRACSPNHSCTQRGSRADPTLATSPPRRRGPGYQPCCPSLHPCTPLCRSPCTGKSSQYSFRPL